MTDRELVHQALDMLKQAKDSVADWGAYASEYFQHKHNLQGSIDDIQAQITVLSERLAQPEQEPVGRLESDPYEGHVFVPRIDGDWSMIGEDLYTNPPQRKPWVGLTDEEKAEIWSLHETSMVVTATEAKLKEKNT